MSGISCRTCGSWEPLAAGVSAGPRPGRGPRSWSPSSAVAGARGGDDCGGSQSLRAHGAVGRAGLGPLAGRKVPGSGKVAGRSPALPLPAAACWVTLGLRDPSPSLSFLSNRDKSEIPWTMNFQEAWISRTRGVGSPSLVHLCVLAWGAPPPRPQARDRASKCAVTEMLVLRQSKSWVC